MPCAAVNLDSLLYDTGVCNNKISSDAFTLQGVSILTATFNVLLGSSSVGSV